MKKIFFTFLLLMGFVITNAQVVVLHPVKIPSNQTEKFLDVEMNFSSKTAQKAVDNGDLMWWGLLKAFNTTSEDYNYMWVNVYKDIDSAVSPKASWWNNAESSVGVKPSILYDGVSGTEADRRYIYQMRQQINSGEEGKFVVFNFATPDNVEGVLSSNEKYVIPQFKKRMKFSGMKGWGAGTKITPQGSNYASFMTFDAFDTMANLMKHLSGDGEAAKGFDWSKLEPMTFESRYIFEIISSTQN